eukprot:6352537-Pyramimonas_sp.AAC.1
MSKILKDRRKGERNAADLTADFSGQVLSAEDARTVQFLSAQLRSNKHLFLCADAAEQKLLNHHEGSSGTMFHRICQHMIAAPWGEKDVVLPAPAASHLYIEAPPTLQDVALKVAKATVGEPSEPSEPDVVLSSILLGLPKNSTQLEALTNEAFESSAQPGDDHCPGKADFIIEGHRRCRFLRVCQETDVIARCSPDTGHWVHAPSLVTGSLITASDDGIHAESVLIIASVGVVACTELHHVV